MTLARGELTLLLQGSYTHLFSWLLLLPGDEMQQIVVARCVMVALLALTAWLVWRLARVWLGGFPALVAPFCLSLHDGRAGARWLVPSRFDACPVERGVAAALGRARVTVATRLAGRASCWESHSR